MRVTYVGPYAEGVEIAATGQLAAPGEPLEVDDRLGLSLCDQPDNWKPADKAAEKLLTALRVERAAGGDPAESPAPDGAVDPTAAVEKGDLP